MIKNNSMDEFYRILSLSIDKLLHNQAGFDTNIHSIKKCQAGEFEFISSIDITGSYTGDILLLASKESMDFVFNIIFGLDLLSLQKEDLVQDGLNEFLNIIVARSTDEFSNTSLPIDVGVPRNKNNNKTAINLFPASGHGCLINTPGGKMLLTFTNKTN